MEKFIINIGRQLGSGGREIGKILAQHYEIAYYDKELIRIAAEESGLSTDFFEKADERNQHSLLGGLFSMRFPFVGDNGVAHDNYLNNDTLFKIQSDIVRKLATQGSSIFVGRCADYILREEPCCINLFISASTDDRIQRIMHQYEIKEEAKALSMIEEADHKRADYYNFYSLKEWGHSNSYDLCINSSALGIEGTVTFLEDFINKRRALIHKTA
ncbi:MAG: cytidylate kinase-like family protein [Bacteroidaceae bacterium]